MLLIVALSLTSIFFVAIQRPRRLELSSNTFNSVSEQAELRFDIKQPEEHKVKTEANKPVYQLDVIDGILYHSFFSPSPEEALADQTVRPIRAHRALSDECIIEWVATGRWQNTCCPTVVQDSQIDLVYVWVNGSCVAFSTFGSSSTSLTILQRSTTPKGATGSIDVHELQDEERSVSGA
jgi:hypothetical protein